VNDTQDDSIIEIYLGEAEYEIRRLLRSALRDLSLEVYQDYDACGPLREAVSGGSPDLIIVDSDLAGGDACDLVQAIRHHRLGTNPFVPVIVTTWHNSNDRVRELIDSGADGVLIKPISINAIHNHVDLIVNNRKPFIVTSRYIGPDRRKDPEHTASVRLIEVPNTLQAKVKGEAIDADVLRRLIARQTMEINLERLRRNAFELSLLVEMTMAGCHSGAPEAELKSNMARLLVVAEDTLGRLAGSGLEQSEDLCKTFVRVVTTIIERGGSTTRIEVQFLKPLSDAILVGFNPNRSQAEMTREVIDSIERIEARQSSRIE
jgi:DNA-binding response OmpR family regulator